jgi:hypothetical protein
MQFDVFIPKYSLAFEYQGEQHYHEVHALGSQWQYADKDEQKRIGCNIKGITLIEVPYWWDFQQKSLRDTIHRSRPDLIGPSDNPMPIPDVPPKYPKPSSN